VGCAALAGLVFSVEARSETTKEFGQWVVGLTTEAEAMYAGTVNDSGDILAEHCTFEDGKCIWSLGMPTKCKLGDSYPMLVNSSSGAAHLMAYCDRKTEGGLHIYQFAWKELEAALKGAKWVGLAFPLDGDAFKVVRFSLEGIDESTKFLEEVFSEALKDGKKGTKSEVL